MDSLFVAIAVIYSNENLIKLETKPTERNMKYDYLKQNFECIIKRAFVGFLLVLSFPLYQKHLY